MNPIPNTYSTMKSKINVKPTERIAAAIAYRRLVTCQTCHAKQRLLSYCIPEGVGGCPPAFTKIKSSGTILLGEKPKPRGSEEQDSPGTASVPCGEAASVASALPRPADLWQFLGILSPLGPCLASRRMLAFAKMPRRREKSTASFKKRGTFPLPLCTSLF